MESKAAERRECGAGMKARAVARGMRLTLLTSPSIKSTFRIELKKMSMKKKSAHATRFSELRIRSGCTSPLPHVEPDSTV